MKEITRYTTPHQIKQYYKELMEQGITPPSFPEVLKMMAGSGTLSEEPLPVPWLDGRMEPEEFIDAYDSIPIKVDQELAELTEEREQHNQVLFPDHRDIICVQHLQPNTFYNQTLTNVYLFTYVYRGTCSYSFDSREICIFPGDLFIATPGFSHSLRKSEDTFALVILIQASAFNILFHDFLAVNTTLSDFFRNAITDKKSGNYCILSCGEDDEPRFYLQAIACEALSENEYSNTNSFCLVKLFLARMHMKYQDTLKIYRREWSHEQPDARNVLRYIQNHYQDVSLGDVAAHFHYNRTYVSRFIHHHFQKSFMEILTELKIENARQYLRKSNKRIADIAQLVGYESPDHFSRIFKKHTGQSPVEYRKNHRRNP